MVKMLNKGLLLLPTMLVLTALISVAQPTISSSFPAKNALNISTTANISVTFNEDMNESTLIGTNVKVFGTLSGYHSGSIQYNSTTKTMEFDPNNDFLVGEKVTFLLKTGVLSFNSNPLASPYLLEFTIETASSSLSFTGRVDYAAGSHPIQSAIADFDNDGDLDVATANGSGNNLSVYLNTGPGKFAAKVDYPSGADVQDIEAADINADGYADIMVVDRDGNSMSVFINNGNGTFVSRVGYGVSESPSSLTSADFDGDGDLDVVTANNNGDNVSVLLNNGNGTFASKVDYPAGDYPNSLTTGDFDSDGDIDIGISNNFSNTVSVLMNNGNGTFASKTDYSTGSGSTYYIQAGDLDNDGYLDLMAAKGTGNFFALFKNNGDGTFASKVNIGSSYNTNDVNFSDIDGDNDLDIVAAQGYVIEVVYNNGDATFTGSSSISSPNYATNVALGDIDRDGKIDLVTSGYFAGKISVFKTVQPLSISAFSPSKNSHSAETNTNISMTFNQALNSSTINNNRFKVVGSHSGIHDGSISNNTATKTITFDPDENFLPGELVTVAFFSSIKSNINDSLSHTYFWSFKVKSGLSDGTFSSAVNYSAGPVDAGPKFITSADFNGDGYSDLVSIYNTSPTYLSVFINDGDGTFAPKVDYETYYQSGGIAVADIDNDGDIDMISCSRGAGYINVLKNYGDGTFAANEPYQSGSYPLSIISADVNGDGYSDIITANEIGFVSVLMNIGDGSFGENVNYSTGDVVYCVTAADINNDGSIDLLASNGDSDQISVFTNNGNGTFAAKVNYPTADTPYRLTTADVNSDGNIDVLVSNYGTGSGGTSFASVLMNNGNGTFASKVDYKIANGGLGIISADVNGDGKADIAVSCVTSDSLTILTNNGNGTFAAKVNYYMGDYPLSLTSGDFDGDGTADIVSANNFSFNISVLLNEGLPDGTNEVSGQYNDVSFDSETNLSGNLTVVGTLTVGAQITTGANTIDLGTTGSISGETPANYIVGKVQTTRTVSSAQNNIGGLGISIDPQSNNLGSTVIKRETGTAENSSSIKQVWTITPATQPSGPVTVTLTWPSTNDNSINLNDLVVYKSEDGGDTWNVISATINKDSDPRTATFSISSFSQFTVGQSGALPVELVSFAGRESNGKVMLNWSTATESNNVGWEIESRIQESGDRSQNSGWKKVGFVAGKGTTTEKQSYSFAVSSLQSSVSIVEFRLKQMDSDGKISYSNVLTINLTPVTFGLSQNYPNPFNPVTLISYQIAADSDVKLVVYDLLGREVASLVNEKKTAGFYTVSFNATNISTGVYFYKLTAGNFSEIKKMTILK